MSDIKEYTRGSLNPKHVFSTLRYKLLFAQNNPDYFYPAGIWVFCGPQGSGKTLSMVQTLKEILKDYPKAIVCSNLEIKGLDRDVIPFTDYSQIETLTNGIHGVIFVIDEIHILWNSMEALKIPISEMSCMCQMRKDRRLILGTSQRLNRMAKPIREQMQYVIDCRCLFGLLQMNQIVDPNDGEEVDGRLHATKIASRFWFHRPALYDSYDTLFKIKKAKREIKSKGG